MTTSPNVSMTAPRRGRTLEVVRAETSADEELRNQQRKFFADTLMATTTKRGQPFDDKTIRAYLDVVDVWHKWLTDFGFEGGFENATILHLNGFLADYLRTHTLGGTVTKQRNLRAFLKHLTEEYDSTNLWDHPKRNKYNRRDERAPVLDEHVVEDLLKVTEGRGFTERRDHAIIRLLLNGPRREEVARLDVESLDLDSAVRTALLPGLKGHAARRIGLGNKDVLAIQRWLRAREQHRRIGRYPNATDGNPLWIAEKTGRRLQAATIYDMVRWRAVQAGYDKSVVYTHLFRHTAAHEFLDAGGTDSNAMAHFGWKDRSMLDRYGASMAESRAIKAVTESGFGDRH